jgi:hypothetical protein
MYKVFQKELYHGIPNDTFGRVLLKTFALKGVQTIQRSTL